jgi:hypothetical protein
MNKLIARAAASATLLAGLGGSALASGNLDITGPGSTNIIDLSHINRVNTNTLNSITPDNFSFQLARSGSVIINHNTKTFDGVSGSGNASNFNHEDNSTNLTSDARTELPIVFNNEDGHNALLDTTGPNSSNRIIENNSNQININTFNAVHSLNDNSQSATSGDVRISGNTIANGGSGSGEATNMNSGSNVVDITNHPSGIGLIVGSSSGNNADMAVTGPDSTNIIRTTDAHSFTQNTANNVSSTNLNNQTARSGDVIVSGNTIAEGFGGSGDASNINSGTNDSQISNN